MTRTTIPSRTMTLVARWRAYTEEQQKLNADIEQAAGGSDRVFVLNPSLEGELGIGRGATDKPRRIADELSKRGVPELPIELKRAVEGLLAWIHRFGGRVPSGS